MFTLQNLEYRIKDTSILPGQSLNVSEGQHLLLHGRSGCGKTTLMNLMSGLLRATSGEISFKGQQYDTLSDTRLDSLRAQNFGFVFQRLHLVGHLSVRQNIALAQTKPNAARIDELIADLGLSDKSEQKAQSLSVGEAQRVAIARAVANNPSVIFADEPTSALDDQNTERVMELLFAQADKTQATVIAATHDARIKARFDTVLEMTA